MGEANRRKKLDPNYGKPVIIGDKTDLEWKKYLRFTDKEWQKIKPHFRVVETTDDVDDSVDGIWTFINENGKRIISFTGSFVDMHPDMR